MLADLPSHLIKLQPGNGASDGREWPEVSGGTCSRSASELLPFLSGEFRAPVDGIVGLADLLLETSLNPEQREYAMLIRKNGETLLSRLNGLPVHSGLAASKVHPRDFDPECAGGHDLPIAATLPGAKYASGERIPDAGTAGHPAPPNGCHDADNFPSIERTAVLKHVSGDQAPTGEALRRFVRETPARIQSVAGAIAFGRFLLAADTAHAIQGDANSLGAGALAAVASRVEVAARTQDAHAMTALLPALKHQFVILRNAILERHRDVSAPAE